MDQEAYIRHLGLEVAHEVSSGRQESQFCSVLVMLGLEHVSSLSETQFPFLHLAHRGWLG